MADTFESNKIPFKYQRVSPVTNRSIEQNITLVNVFDKDLKKVEIIESVKQLENEIKNEEKVGQFLLSFVSLCHEKGIDAETALRKAITNYRKELES
ncbi:MAG: hypothetical protein ACO3DO_05605 [Candidatus Nanopelagicales bacterium]